jgi:hypothetical protein
VSTREVERADLNYLVAVVGRLGAPLLKRDKRDGYVWIVVDELMFRLMVGKRGERELCDVI